MKQDGLLLKLVKNMVKLYRVMPVKVFAPFLRKLYFSFLNARSSGSVVLKEIDGINFELDLKEVIDSAMYYEGGRELGTSQALKKLCKHGYVVFDIGANVGSHALPIARDVGPSGKMYAFEPVPWALKKMRRNIELNSFDNITIEPIALSDVNQTGVPMKFRASFKVDSISSVGDDGKINNGWWNECEDVLVNMETLDSYVEARNISRLDLIKLDVDGFEGKVLRGGSEILKRFQPILIMEIAPAWTEMRGDKMMDLITNLEELNYKFYSEKDFSHIHDMSQRIKDTPPGGGFNVIASVHSLN